MAASHSANQIISTDQKAGPAVLLLARSDHFSNDQSAEDEKKGVKFDEHLRSICRDSKEHFGKYEKNFRKPLPWRPHFGYVKVLNVAAKFAGVKSRLVSLYYTNTDDLMESRTGEDDELSQFDYSQCFSLYRLPSEITDINKIVCPFYSSALLKVKTVEFSYLGPEKIKCVQITTLNNLDQDYRHGSVLIQLAIECSLHDGNAGRVFLQADGPAYGFYQKLGFVRKGDCFFYLPFEAIETWKEKIANHPIYLSPEEVDKFCRKNQRQSFAPAAKTSSASVVDFSFLAERQQDTEKNMTAQSAVCVSPPLP